MINRKQKGMINRRQKGMINRGGHGKTSISPHKVSGSIFSLLDDTSRSTREWSLNTAGEISLSRLLEESALE